MEQTLKEKIKNLNQQIYKYQIKILELKANKDCNSIILVRIKTRQVNKLQIYLLELLDQLKLYKLYMEPPPVYTPIDDYGEPPEYSF